MSPALDKLLWKDARDIGDHKVVSGDAERYVARIFYKGIYLTGFIKVDTNELFVVDKDGKLIDCSLFVQVLTCADISDYSWVEYEPGELIPSSAVVGGFGEDGTPLYVVNVKLLHWKPSYYDDRNKRLHVKGIRNRTVNAVKMLIENWFRF